MGKNAIKRIAVITLFCLICWVTVSVTTAVVRAAVTPFIVEATLATESKDSGTPFWEQLVKDAPITAVLFFVMLRLEKRSDKILELVGNLSTEIHAYVELQRSQGDARTAAVIEAMEGTVKTLCDKMTSGGKKG